MSTDNCGDSCLSENVDYAGWEAPGIGRSLVFMAAQGLVYMFVLYLLESDGFQRAMRVMTERGGDDGDQGDVEMATVNGGMPLHTAVEDDDVVEERQRIVNTSGASRMLSFTHGATR